MEENLKWMMVQQQIGNYKFKNLNLLKQAFTRRSFAEENGGESNEVLEFIGDKVLDMAVVQILTEHFGTADTQFHSERDENELTKLKSRMVSKHALANRIEELGFADFLIMGKGDIKNAVNNEASVQEDLFEAIIGAVAIDSKWDAKEIRSVVEIMLDPDAFMGDETDTNYVRLIQEWDLNEHGCIPLYKYEPASPLSPPCRYAELQVIEKPILSNPNYMKIKYRCELKLLNDFPVFCAYGESKREARASVCEFAYAYLEENDLLPTIWDEIEDPSWDMAINQLEILARRGYFSIPAYDFSKEYDMNGNPIWKCRCSIEEEERSFSEFSSTKKNAKKGAAYSMLMYVLGMEAE